MFLLVTLLNAQTTISAGGGQGSSIAGKVDYTIGQIGYSNYSASTGRINEGVQQPFEILILKIGNSDDPESPIIYPNPTFDKVYINLRSLDEAVFYEIINLDGRIQLANKIKDAITEISMSDLPKNIYLLKIYKSKNKFTTFKLIKIN